jgi:hypothetical protein
VVAEALERVDVGLVCHGLSMLGIRFVAVMPENETAERGHDNPPA